MRGGPARIVVRRSTPPRLRATPCCRQIATLVDPYALELDQDYDCAHASTPLCDYILYGPLCAPVPSKAGTDIFTDKYGSIDPTW